MGKNSSCLTLHPSSCLQGCLVVCHDPLMKIGAWLSSLPEARLGPHAASTLPASGELELVTTVLRSPYLLAGLELPRTLRCGFLSL